MKRFIEVELRLSNPRFDYDEDAERRQRERDVFISEEVAALSAISQILVGGEDLCQSSL